MTHDEIVEFLKRRHPPHRWAFFKELRIGTGYANITAYDKERRRWNREPWEQRIDAWAISYWPSEECRQIAYEVKTTRSDFLREVKDPQKRKAAMELSNKFYFVVPKGMVSKSDIPDECGLIEVYRSGRLRTVIEPLLRRTNDPPWRFVASLARRSTIYNEEPQ